MAGGDTPTPTYSVTEAYRTVQARLTEVVARTPSPMTPSPTIEGQTATATPSPTATATRPTPTPSPTTPCDAAAAGTPIDVTIPDDTVLEPGQTFTKIWRLVNVGTCIWTTEYAAVWFSGDMLSAPSSVSMPDEINPGETVAIDVDMTAPRVPGTYQSNWKLQNASGVLFGIGPGADSSFWARIEVDELPTFTPEPSPEATLTPAPSATVVVEASGAVALSPEDEIDLDTLQVNAGTPDLRYQINESGNALLSPLSDALLGVFGTSAPSKTACESANLSSASLPVESLAPGSYLCYRSDGDLYGWARLDSLDPEDFTLSAEFLTWATGA